MCNSQKEKKLLKFFLKNFVFEAANLQKRNPWFLKNVLHESLPFLSTQRHSDPVTWQFPTFVGFSLNKVLLFLYLLDFVFIHFAAKYSWRTQREGY